jgi:bifunctional non-homologous end joining protein LigD
MADANTLLREYRQKRDFSKTAEPSGQKAVVAAIRERAKKSGQGIFVVQKHDATRLHYDFRLELDGVLKSWAVTKGPSLNPQDKRLAVHVEDHPLDYAAFEGTIPEGEYGGGTVMLWDFGTWEPVGDPHKGLEKGDLKFILHGERLKGSWVLVHMKGRDQARRSGGTRENWLLIKHNDAEAREDDPIVERFTTSIETGRDLEGIAKGLKSKIKGKGVVPQTSVWTRKGAVNLPAFRKPQLATLVDEVPTGPDWLMEMKYDGYRALAAIAGDQVRIFTRNGLDWTTEFARLTQPLSRLTKGSALIDGEICAFDDQGRSDFSKLKEALSNGGDLVYFVFDLLEEDGEDLTPLPLHERKEHLRKLVGKLQKDGPIQFSEHVQGNALKVYEAICRGGYEGIIAKGVNDPYRSERTKSWLKVKCSRRQEFVIGGWRPSEKRNRFASLLLGSWEDGKLVYHGRVGTGFNEKDAAALQAALDKRARKTPPFAAVPSDIQRRAHWVEPELVAEIAYTEFTADGHLRHPSFIGLREDKPAGSVTLEMPQDVPNEAKPRRPARQAAATSVKTEAKARAPAKPRSRSKVDLSIEAGQAAAEAAKVKLTSPERVVYPEQGITKGELIAYYAAVADAMLPYIADRPLSLVRCPQGRSKYCFFQKHDSGTFPAGFHQIPIAEKDGVVQDYLYLDDVQGLIAGVQMNTLEWHIWGALKGDVEKPERIIFDIDPDEGLTFEHVRDAAFDFRDLLGTLGLKTYPMVTGGKGIHVIAPLQPKLEWPEVKAFCRGFAMMVSSAQPDRFLANMSKARRHGKMFVDYLRNERGSTAICPYSTRSREGAPVATPISWQELKTLDRANGFSLAEAAARAKGKKDPWPDYFKQKQSITPQMLKAVGV